MSLRSAVPPSGSRLCAAARPGHARVL